MLGADHVYMESARRIKFFKSNSSGGWESDKGFEQSVPTACLPGPGQVNSQRRHKPITSPQSENQAEYCGLSLPTIE
jgi:hypothetical protein